MLDGSSLIQISCLSKQAALLLIFCVVGFPTNVSNWNGLHPVFLSADPLSMSPQKALETIGANLQKQYENWQPRVSHGPASLLHDALSYSDTHA